MCWCFLVWQCKCSNIFVNFKIIYSKKWLQNRPSVTPVARGLRRLPRVSHQKTQGTGSLFESVALQSCFTRFEIHFFVLNRNNKYKRHHSCRDDGALADKEVWMVVCLLVSFAQFPLVWLSVGGKYCSQLRKVLLAVRDCMPHRADFYG